MAPRGRRKKPGLMREDAAKDAMRVFGFPECVISASIKELLEFYIFCIAGAEQEQPVEDGRDHVGSNSTTTLVGYGTVIETQNCPTDAISTTTEAAAMDSSPPASHSGEAFEGGGWLSEEDTDPDEDLDGGGRDDDDEMIQLTPEPLSEELEELVREVRGQKKRKRPSRWDLES